MTGVPPTWVKRIPCHRTRLQNRCISCGGGMEKSTSSSPPLRLVSTAGEAVLAGSAPRVLVVVGGSQLPPVSTAA